MLLLPDILKAPCQIARNKLFQGTTNFTFNDTRNLNCFSVRELELQISTPIPLFMALFDPAPNPFIILQALRANLLEQDKRSFDR